VFPRFLFLFGLLVAELAIIDEPANRRSGPKRNLDQLYSLGARHVDGVHEGKNAKLIALNPYDPDFAGADFAINPDE